MNGISRVDLVAVCACMRVCGAFLRDTCIFYIPVSGLARSLSALAKIAIIEESYPQGSPPRYWSSILVTACCYLLFTLYTLSSFLEIRLYIPPFLGSEAMFFIRELIVARVQGSS